MPPPPTSSLATQLLSQLTLTKSLHPTSTWLEAFLSTQKPSTPLQVLVSSAAFRILASPITETLSRTPTSCFPPDVQSASIKERRLAGPIVAQILDIEDMSKSRWEQIEAMEALERGEGTKGREIIRVAAPASSDDDESAPPNPDPSTAGKPSTGPHKLWLEDAKGSKVCAIELRPVEGVVLGMNVGSKLCLRSLLGGKVEALHTGWKEGRKARLNAAIEAAGRDREQ